MSNSTRKSIPKGKEIYGIEIKKLPIGAYLNALETIKELPETLMGELFPNAGTREIMTLLKTLDVNSFIALACRAITIIPNEFIGFLSRLLGCSEETIRNDITPNELSEILVAMWEVNDLSNFTLNAKRLVSKVMNRTTDGSNG